MVADQFTFSLSCLLLVLWSDLLFLPQPAHILNPEALIEQTSHSSDVHLSHFILGNAKHSCLSCGVTLTVSLLL